MTIFEKVAVFSASIKDPRPLRFRFVGIWLRETPKTDRSIADNTQ
jgi:hypothetical protein